MVTKNINPQTALVFDIKVNEACKSCKRYGLTGCCPPAIGDFNYYRKLLKRYNYGKVFIETFKIDDMNNYKELSRKSSLLLHKVLLKEREILLSKGHYFNIVLGGGSCKWCKECVIPCRFPQFRAIPIEATGINVVATLKKLNIKITFPVKNNFVRVGIMLWD